MDWIDDGIVLSARKHGESAVVVSLLTSAHGRHAGLVRGGSGARARGLYQPGNLLRATWRARLAEHLGHFACEMAQAHAARLLDQRLPLLALSAATTLLDMALPEREPHPGLFAATLSLVEALGAPGWEVRYVRWEVSLLAELGFGLDLSCCAATGTNDGLVWVSPRSGRAVSAAAGEPWRGQLLALPAFLVAPSDAPPTPNDIESGLQLTGHFLTRYVFGPETRGMPDVRARLLSGLAGARPALSMPGIPIDSGTDGV